jgi:hypothetical protein
MIGSRGYPIAEPPRTSPGPARSLPPPESFPHLRAWPFPCFRAGPALRARAPPAARKIATRGGRGRASVAANQGPGYGAGPAEAPASPGEPRSTRNRLRNATEYGTELRYDYKDYIGSRPMQGVRRPF